jgi:hypothetical protein
MVFGGFPFHPARENASAFYREALFHMIDSVRVTEDIRTNLETRLNTLDSEATLIRATLQQMETQAQTQTLRDQIGKCFRRRLYYDLDSPGWWIYFRVQDVIDQRPSGMSFRVTPSGDIQIATEDRFDLENEELEEIPQTEFERAWAMLLDKMNGMMAFTGREMVILEGPCFAMVAGHR